MHTQMSENTRQEVLVQKRERYARAGKAPKSQITTELAELFAIIATRYLRLPTLSPWERARVRV
jgi:hypothetical protein